MIRQLVHILDAPIWENKGISRARQNIQSALDKFVLISGELHMKRKVREMPRYNLFISAKLRHYHEKYPHLTRQELMQLANKAWKRLNQ